MDFLRSLLRGAAGTLVVAVVIDVFEFVRGGEFDWRLAYIAPMAFWRVLVIVFIGMVVWDYWFTRRRAGVIRNS